MVVLFRSIKSWATRFFKKPLDTSKEDESNTPKEDDKASVVFNLDMNGNIDVQFIWPDIEVMTNNQCKELSKNYSALISIINLGGFKADILKILLHSQKNTKCAVDKIFIADVLKYLTDSENIASAASSLPVVSPTKVFK